jgi:hypothetical protein
VLQPQRILKRVLFFQGVCPVAHHLLLQRITHVDLFQIALPKFLACDGTIAAVVDGEVGGVCCCVIVQT